jgi:hypothetical protein
VTDAPTGQPARLPGFRPFDLNDAVANLPGSLLDAIDATGGGIWWGGDHYTDAATIVRRAREEGARALVLDARDLSFLAELPDLRYLYVATDGMPVLDPVAALPKLEALLIHAKAMRGSFDPFSRSRLRWLRLSLGGKGGRAVAERFPVGHEALEWLSITEVPYRTIAEAAPAFPRLRHLRLHFADHIRRPGDLSPVAPTLRGLELDFSGIQTLDGLEVLTGLESLSITGGKAKDLSSIAALPSLRYLRAEIAGVSLEALRGHSHLRMLVLPRRDQPDRSILESIPNLVAVGHGAITGPALPWPDLAKSDADPDLRREWSRAVRG